MLLTTDLEKRLLDQLTKAEALLANIQHGLYKDNVKPPVREYFSEYERCRLICELRNSAFDQAVFHG